MLEAGTGWNATTSRRVRVRAPSKQYILRSRAQQELIRATTLGLIIANALLYDKPTINKNNWRANQRTRFFFLSPGLRNHVLQRKFTSFFLSVYTSAVASHFSNKSTTRTQPAGTVHLLSLHGTHTHLTNRSLCEFHLFLPYYRFCTSHAPSSQLWELQ